MKYHMKYYIWIIAFLVILSLIFVYSFNKENKEENVNIFVYPESSYIQEGESTKIILSLSVNGGGYKAKVNWILKASGDTGELILENDSFTDEHGKLMAIYIAPEDVDEMEHKVGIIASVKIDEKKWEAYTNITVYPELHETELYMECDREKMIAGETAIFRAYLLVYDEKWHPLENATIKWKFYANGVLFMEKENKTDENGMAKMPFFFSNAKKNTTVKVIAEFRRNLSGRMDYEGSRANKSISIIPEKPGDFPVVLIHGWTGSITNVLINYTWWNLTKKLEAHGFKVLDFDVTKPGIQWLTYEPGWFEEHHIPWIAARVCEKIKDALILNGYPPNQTIDIVAHSMGGLVARFMAEHYMADVDYWNKSWNGQGYPWYGDGDADITIGAYQIDDLIAVGTPCHGVPPNINESLLRGIIKYAYFPWWIGQVPDMVYDAPFLEAMRYKGTDVVDYYGVGGDIGFIVGDYPRDFDGDGIAHYSDGLCPTESPYLEGKPLYILEGAAWPIGKEDHISLIAINEKVHDYIIEHLID